MDRLSCEFRAVSRERGLAGHGAVFGQVAQIRRGFERIDQRAFDRALREKQEVVLLVNHEGLPLASTANGSLRLGTDERGLTVEVDELPDTQLARDVRELMERQLLTKMSFGFVPKADRMDTVAGRQVRTITDVDLFDVSVVTMPAYAGTDVALRAIEEFDPAPSARAMAAQIRARISRRSA